MEEFEENSSRETEQVPKRIRKAELWKVWREGNRAFLKWGFLTCIVILASLGMLEIYNIYCPDKVPLPIPLFDPTLRREARVNFTSGKTKLDDPKQNWSDLRESLLILERVCPEAAEWVRQKKRENNLEWDANRHDTFARYLVFAEKLCIDPPFWGCSEGNKAAILAHEYRHSCQNPSKIVRSVFYQMFDKTRNDIIEDDADSFERLVFIAIHY